MTLEITTTHNGREYETRQTRNGRWIARVHVAQGRQIAFDRSRTFATPELAIAAVEPKAPRSAAQDAAIRDREFAAECHRETLMDSGLSYDEADDALFA